MHPSQLAVNLLLISAFLGGMASVLDLHAETDAMSQRTIVLNRLGLVAALAPFVWLCHRCVTTHGRAKVPPPLSRVDTPATMAGGENGAGAATRDARSATA